jgi:hypothetical protein
MASDMASEIARELTREGREKKVRDNVEGLAIEIRQGKK